MIESACRRTKIKCAAREDAVEEVPFEPRVFCIERPHVIDVVHVQIGGPCRKAA